MDNRDRPTQLTRPDPTADYRPYPKGPNFKLIVALFCITILVLLIGSWWFLRENPRVVPDAHGPQPNPSLSTPPKNGR